MACGANPNSLWPPNGKPVLVTVSGAISDSGFGVDSSSIRYEVADEYGQLQPTGSVTLGPAGTYSFTVALVASRNGNDLDGRQYRITISAQDNAGNRGTCATVVTVPHDQRK